jgi:hypothetical protein
LLRDFSTVTGQALLDRIARENPEMCKATLRRLKSQMSGIMKLAIQHGYRAAPNPTRETSLPVHRNHGKRKPTISTQFSI